jgi:hypothetical protein
MDPSRALRFAEIGLFALLGGWLLLAAAWVDIEYYDGMDSQLNARFYLGMEPTYQATRGPLLGFLLVPAEAAREALGLHPLDPRPAHFVMALLHFGHLLGSYLLLTRALGRSWMLWLAFAAAMPTFLFFNYGIFISHDLVPGVLYLALLLGSDTYLRRPSRGLWCALALTGAAAVCIKHTYAIFWIIALVIQAGFVLRGTGAPRATLLRRWGELVLAAAAGAVALWFALCQSLGTLFPETPYLLRAWEQLQYLLFQAHDKNHPEHVWVYFRNFPAYGMLAMVMALPGVWLSWRGGTRTGRVLAAGWVLAVVILHLLSLRQVRYFGFVAPVTAGILVPVLTALWTQKWGRRVAVGLLVFNLLPLHAYSILGETTRIGDAFHRRSEYRDLLKHLENPDGSVRRPVYVNWDKLSFTPARPPPFAGDIYHELFHLGQHHVRGFFGLHDPRDFLFMDLPAMQALRDWEDGGALIATTAPLLINPSTWERKPAPTKITLQQMVFLPRVETLHQREEGKYSLAGGETVELEFGFVEGQPAVSFAHPRLRDATEECLAFHARLPGRETVYPLQRRDDGRITVLGVAAADLPPFGAPETLRLRLLKRVHHHHNVSETPEPPPEW